MRRIGLSMLAVVIAVTAAVVLMRSPSGPNIAVEASAMMPITEMHAKLDPAKLPLEDFEDQALIFAAKQKE